MELDKQITAEFSWIGEIEYRAGLRLQDESHQQVLKTGQARVIGCEHARVVTLGRRSHHDLLPPVLGDQNTPLIRCGRGGQVTAHMPGQLVIYCLIPLKSYRFGVREFVETLQTVTLTVLRRLPQSFVCGSSEPGIYLEDGSKVAAFGIEVRKGVTLHGLSINVSNDLSLLDSIVSCGVHGRKHGNLRGIDSGISTKLLFETWSKEFSKALVERS